MHSQQITWNPQQGWTPVQAEPEKVSLVFYFGTRQMLAWQALPRATRDVPGGPYPGLQHRRTDQ